MSDLRSDMQNRETYLAHRHRLIRTIITVGMIRRDVATDVADALIADGWMHEPCLHEQRRPILTEVGTAQQCMRCGDQDFK